MTGRAVIGGAPHDPLGVGQGQALPGMALHATTSKIGGPPLGLGEPVRVVAGDTPQFSRALLVAAALAHLLDVTDRATQHLRLVSGRR